MKKFLKYGWLGLCALLLGSCIEIENFDNTPKGNFEALWKIMDEHYCFFKLKNVDWDAVHVKYAPLITNDMSDTLLYDVLVDMLHEVKDGHVNLQNGGLTGAYMGQYQNYPTNFNLTILEEDYLGSKYFNTGSIQYKILDDNIGYIRYEKFSYGVSETNMDYILYRFRDCHGIILDVRSNPGGNLSNADLIASRFVERKTLVAYIHHKTGKGHDDFSNRLPIYIEPPAGRVLWLRPVVVLTNRRCFSATNAFVSYMSNFPNVITLGDRTGGGAGLPFSSSLPNGWGVRFSASPQYNSKMQEIESGIDPDIFIDQTDEDKANHLDTLIETARKLLNSMNHE
ncbi:peptidase S41 [Bacteroidia bacterium]|nr:peptidase S41 [Bacteroidia bacterium]